MATPRVIRPSAKPKVITIGIARVKTEDAVGADDLRAQLARIAGRKAPAEGAEVNPDGNSYHATIQRYRDRVRNPMTAIRSKCVECCNGSTAEVAQCTIKTCSLWLFRGGKNPFHSRSKTRIEVDQAAQAELDGIDDGGDEG